MIGVRSATAAIPNRRKVTSTPSELELGLNPHFTARMRPRGRRKRTRSGYYMSLTAHGVAWAEHSPPWQPFCEQVP